IWEQKALHRRGLTAPALDGDTLVIGDFQGYVHWLDAATGELLARHKTDGKRITNSPVVVDGRVYVLTDNGRLSAFQHGGRLAVSEAGKKAEAESAQKAEKKRQKQIEKATKPEKKKDDSSSDDVPTGGRTGRRGGGY